MLPECWDQAVKREANKQRVERVDGSPQLGFPSDLLSKPKASLGLPFFGHGVLGVQNPVIVQCFWGLRATHMRFT